MPGFIVPPNYIGTDMLCTLYTHTGVSTPYIDLNDRDRERAKKKLHEQEKNTVCCSFGLMIPGIHLLWSISNNILTGMKVIILL